MSRLTLTPYEMGSNFRKHGHDVGANPYLGSQKAHTEFIAGFNDKAKELADLAASVDHND